MTFYPPTKSNSNDSVNKVNDDLTSSDNSKDYPTFKINHFRDDNNENIRFGRSISDNLMISMQNLNLPSPLPEENEDYLSNSSPRKRRSPTNLRVRIKSPYQNKTNFFDEKKRKRLLEIRDKRDRKKKEKNLMNENSRPARNKYSKGPIMAQVSNSVTKLSITNKSFYDTIYGQNSKNIKVRGSRKDLKKHTGDDIHLHIQSINTEKDKYLDENISTTDIIKYMDVKKLKNEDDLSVFNLSRRDSGDFDIIQPFSNFSANVNHESLNG